MTDGAALAAVSKVIPDGLISVKQPAKNKEIAVSIMVFRIDRSVSAAILGALRRSPGLALADLWICVPILRWLESSLGWAFFGKKHVAFRATERRLASAISKKHCLKTTTLNAF